jgi:mRNA interferase RelE/StbE
MASWRIEFTRSASKDLRALDAKLVARLLTAIEALAADPHPPGSKKLASSLATHRLRVGDYRVVYEIDVGILLILVVRIRHRREVYR